MPQPSFISTAARRLKRCCSDKLPIQLEYLNTPATAGHALLPARVSRPASRSTNCSPWSTIWTGKRRKFDFAGVHAANIHAFFHHNDGRPPSASPIFWSAPTIPRSLCLAFQRGPWHAAEPEPRANRQGRRQPAVRIGGDRERCAPGSIRPGATSASNLPTSGALLEQIALHDKCDPSLFA